MGSQIPRGSRTNRKLGTAVKLTGNTQTAECQAGRLVAVAMPTYRYQTGVGGICRAISSTFPKLLLCNRLIAVRYLVRTSECRGYKCSIVRPGEEGGGRDRRGATSLLHKGSVPEEHLEAAGRVTKALNPSGRSLLL